MINDRQPCTSLQATGRSNPRDSPNTFSEKKNSKHVHYRRKASRVNSDTPTPRWLTSEGLRRLEGSPHVCLARRLWQRRSPHIPLRGLGRGGIVAPRPPASAQEYPFHARVCGVHLHSLLHAGGQQAPGDVVLWREGHPRSVCHVLHGRRNDRREAASGQHRHARRPHQGRPTHLWHKHGVRMMQQIDEANNGTEEENDILPKTTKDSIIKINRTRQNHKRTSDENCTFRKKSKQSERKLK